MQYHILLYGRLIFRALISQIEVRNVRYGHGHAPLLWTSKISAFVLILTETSSEKVFALSKGC